jgi:hypothetical protein
MSDAIMNIPTPDPGFEVVHFVLGYFDGVFVGIADWRGAPHHFELEDDLASGGEPQNRYRLTPLPPEIFRAAVDAWEIWCRWEHAQRDGLPALRPDQHPALPEDEEQRREAEQLVSDWLARSKAASFLACAELEPLIQGAQHGTVRGALQVRWTEPGAVPGSV